MPKAQIPVGTAKAVQHISYGGSDAVNVLYYVLGDVGSHTPGEVVASIAAATQQLYSTMFATAALPNNWALTWCTVTYRDATDSLVRVRVSDAYAGTASSGGQDAQVAYLINWSNSDPRRGGKPRQYIPGVLDVVMADSATLTGAQQTALNSSLVTWLTSLITTGTGRVVTMQLVEMSFRDGKAWRTTPVTFPIIGGTVNPVVATQRRRVDRRRPS